LERGLVERVADRPEDALVGADIVVLAAPPLGCLDLLESLAGRWRGALPADATVTDVASTKASIVGRAAELGLPFVGGHPMAGREIAGFGGARPDLFDGRPWVVVPAATARPIDVRRVEWLAGACGARIVRLDAPGHDAATAAISHLPLVMSVALVEAVAGRPGRSIPPGWPTARDLSAGGWAGMTRLTRGDATMGAGILATNAGPVAARIRELRAVLDEWIEVLESPGGPDAADLEARLRDARGRLEGPADER